MKYYFAKFYDILYSNLDTTYIFHFLAIFFTEILKEKDAFLKLNFL